MTEPLVAIVGRPNVGKSTLFNRILDRREAIVDNQPGTTRDRILAEIRWNKHLFLLADTGGLEPPSEDGLLQLVRAQAETAIQEADVIICLVDGAQGLSPMDLEIASWLRLIEKPVILAMNKADNPGRELAIHEFHSLGLGNPIPISAYHNLGIFDLMDQVIELLPESQEEGQFIAGAARLAILGRTNVGKSQLLNSILNEERAVVSDIPGTTRDSLDTPITYEGHPLILIDTAGIRRRGKIRPGLEQYAVIRSLKALDRSDIALLVMDATELATAQDIHVAGMAWDQHKGINIVINKWDLVSEDTGTEKEQCIQEIRRQLHFIPQIPICFTSALLHQGIETLLSTTMEIYQERVTEIPDADLHQVALNAVAQHQPPGQGKRRLNIYEITQVGTNPPTIIFTVNDPALIHFSYRRYLANQIRTNLGFRYTYPKLMFRKKRKSKQ